MSIEPPTEKLGLEGETCEECGAELATDQRYCLNCGHARTARRLNFQKYMTANGNGADPVAASAMGGAGAVQTNVPPVLQQWSPIAAIGVVGLLGVMLLLGVLIGKDDNSTQTVAAAAAPTTTTTPTDTTAAVTTDKSKADKAKKAGAGAGAGSGNIEAGGSGSTEGITAADPNASALENAKNGPTQVATQGAPAKLDPNGQAGAGSDSVCIGC